MLARIVYIMVFSLLSGRDAHSANVVANGYPLVIHYQVPDNAKVSVVSTAYAHVSHAADCNDPFHHSYPFKVARHRIRVSVDTGNPITDYAAVRPVSMSDASFLLREDYFPSSKHSVGIFQPPRQEQPMTTLQDTLIG